MEENADCIWTKPATSFKLKKRMSRGRPGISSNQFVSGAGDTKEQEEAERPRKRPRLDTLGLRVSEARVGQVGEPCGDSQDSGLELSSPSGRSESKAVSGPRSPPLDWSLKSRAMFSSGSSFGWSQHLSTVEEASGVTGGVRCLDLGRGSHCLDTSLRAQFHAACLYWQHPSLPVCLFPRFSQSSLRPASSPGSPASLSLSPDMQRALHSDWMSSLQSAYQLVKARQCPYFYLLAPAFTCIFRAAGISGSQEISAMLAPTTQGLRAALRREDVQFSLPLYKPRKEEEEEEEELPECDTTKGFLESLGIEADSLPGLASAAPKHRLAAGHGSGKNIDGRADSLVLVEGVECQSLLNYLLNAKLVLGQGVSSLPPTLLAPIAFHGATLRSLKVRQTTVGVRSSGKVQHTIDVTGPILPSAVQSIVRLAATHSPQYSATLHTAQETVSFCQATREGTHSTAAPSAFASASLGDCGLSAELLETFTSLPSRSEDTMARDLLWRAGAGFSINTESIIET